MKEQLNALTARNASLENRLSELQSMKHKMEEFEAMYAKMKEFEERQAHQEYLETMDRPEDDPLALATVRRNLAFGPSKKTRAKKPE